MVSDTTGMPLWLRSTPSAWVSRPGPEPSVAAGPVRPRRSWASDRPRTTSPERSRTAEAVPSAPQTMFMAWWMP